MSSFIKMGFFVIFPFFIWTEPLKMEIKGEAGLMMNAQTGAVLFEHNAHNQYYPASTTKVATALYALKLKGDELTLPITAEQNSLAWMDHEAKRKSNYTLPPHWLEPGGTHIGIKNGEILTLHDRMKGMLISSGNDAANVIAHALGPTIPVFMEGMNSYLKELGCKQTFFCNTHGLHDPKHLSTAYELCLITREALKNPVFRDIVSQSRFLRPKTNKQAATTLLQTNRLIRPGKLHYPKAIGVKTGYHAKAKKNLIAAAESEGRILILVLLGYQDPNEIFQDAIKLFEAAFNQPKVRRVFLKAGPQSFTWNIPKSALPLQTHLTEELSLDYYPAEDPKVKCLLYCYPTSLPIAQNQEVGELQLTDAKGQILQKAPLVASQEVMLAWPYNWQASFSTFSWITLGSAIFLLGGIYLLWKRKF